MDPNANIREQLELVGRLRALTNDDIPIEGRAEAIARAAARLADLVEALDRWLLTGGFLPARWMPLADAIGRVPV